MRARHYTALILVASLGIGTSVDRSTTAAGAATTGHDNGPDFNGDGYDDLVIADRNHEVNGHSGAGQVWVLPGSRSGPSIPNRQMWSQLTFGVPGEPAVDEEFGAAWATGNFNGDRFSDIAICAPRDVVSGETGAGGLVVLLGSAAGLTTTGAKALHRNTPGVPGVATTDERWCDEGLVAGDFDGDGRDDLAITSVWTDVNGRTDAGSVTVLRSGRSGPSGVGALEINQASRGVFGPVQENDYFGSFGIAAGDLNGDRRDELVVVMDDLDVNGVTDAGGVFVFPGSASGVKTLGSTVITRATAGVPGALTEYGEFGAGRPAIADWNKDGYGDLAIVDPEATIGGALEAGQVLILRGSPRGVTAVGISVLNQNRAGVPDTAEADEWFGFESLATADFNGDGRADLAVGNPYEDIGAVVNAGAVFTFYGNGTTVAAFDSRMHHADSSGMPGSPTTDGLLAGNLIWTGDYNGDGYADLALGCSGCDTMTAANVGTVTILRGSSGGISTVGVRLLRRSSIPGEIDDPDAHFGVAA